MSNAIEQILGFTIFFTMMLSVLADIILAVTWTKLYFTSGILLFSRHISIIEHHTNIPSCSLLNNRLYSFWMGGFIFKELETNKYGFRRQFFSFAPKPIMHGLVIFDSENNRITVKGYLDWFIASFSIILLVLSLIIAPAIWLIETVTVSKDFLFAAIGAIVFYGLIIGILYLIDYYRLEKIISVAVELWSRKHV
jgi:hypothetical protein